MTLSHSTAVGGTTFSPALAVTHEGDVRFYGDATNATWDANDNSLEFVDGSSTLFGTGGDMKIWHNGNVNRIDLTSPLQIEGDGSSFDLLQLQMSGGSGKTIELTADNSGTYWDFTGYAYLRPERSTANALKIDTNGNVDVNGNLNVIQGSNDTLAQFKLSGDGETAGDVFTRIAAQNLHHGTGTYGGEAHIDFRMASYQHSDRDGADILVSVADAVGVMAPALAIESPTTAGTGTTTKTTVFGTLKILGGSPGAGKLLTSNGAGDATWEAPASSGTSVEKAIAIAMIFS